MRAQRQEGVEIVFDLLCCGKGPPSATVPAPGGDESSDQLEL